MTGGSNIDYDALALDAMRGVVRNVLARTAKSGLPGDHHFYISFSTEVAGVTLSKRLKERYPREMTIVLQHRFWDLLVGDDRFEVKLTFDSIPERLVVPFAAIKVFFDPSVQYGLRFEDGDAATGEANDPTTGPGVTTGGARTLPRATPSKRPRPAKKTKTDRDGVVAIGSAAQTAQPSQSPQQSQPVVPLAPRPVPLAPVAQAPAPAPAATGASETPSTDAQSDVQDKPANAGAQILSLDQFRKK